MSKLIPLTQGKFAIVDDEDYEWLNQWKWCAFINESGQCYAARGTRRNHQRKTILMHRLIMNATKGQIIDHKNHNSSDNRRANLRICTHQQNDRNRRKVFGSSKFKGVSWKKSNSCWCAYIKINGKHKSLGFFHNEIDAAKAYDVKAKELFGEFAKTNF